MIKRFLTALSFVIVLLWAAENTYAQGLWSHPDTIRNHLAQSHGGVPHGMSDYELEVYHSQLHEAARGRQMTPTRTRITYTARILPKRWFRR